LVISVPLGYFGGIGAASKMEFYLKGQFFLDMATIQNVVMDKTGTILTEEGVSKSKKLFFKPDFNKDEILKWSMPWKVKAHIQ
jgi:Cd2+/Zn2+-exporting ATPase